MFYLSVLDYVKDYGGHQVFQCDYFLSTLENEHFVVGKWTSLDWNCESLLLPFFWCVLVLVKVRKGNLKVQSIVTSK